MYRYRIGKNVFHQNTVILPVCVAGLSCVLNSIVFFIFYSLNALQYNVPKTSGKVRVIRHSDPGSSPNKPDFSVKSIA
jgi:hypothetical protein